MSPFAQSIVSHLTLASNDAVAIAIGWHIAGAAAVVALLRGWRLSKRRAGVLLTAPIISAATVSFVFGNAFNAGALTALAVTLIILARHLGSDRIARGSRLTTAVGFLTIVFGITYPHFLEAESVLTYVYAAPTGVIPCPTLSVVVGITLVANGLGSRAWRLTIATAGLFYGLVGVAFLGVLIDVVLLAGAVLLVPAALFEIPRRYSSVT